MNIPVQTMFNTIKSNQTQHQLFFMMSPSDLLATASSECLQERCSRHRHWETHENSEQLQPIHNMKTCLESICFHSGHNVSFAMLSGLLSQDNSTPSCYTRHSPLLNSRTWTLNSDCTMCTNAHSMPSCQKGEWTSSWLKALEREKIANYSLAFARSASGCLQITWYSTISMDTLVYNHWYSWALRILMAQTRQFQWPGCVALLARRTAHFPYSLLWLGMEGFWQTAPQALQGRSLAALPSWQGCSLQMWPQAMPVVSAPWVVPSGVLPEGAWFRVEGT